MQITPVVSPVTSAETQAPVSSVRRIQMRTNASPERNLPPKEEETDPNSAISDTNEPTKEAVEVTKPLSPQFAALAKQRRALQVKERELAVREAQMKDTPSGYPKERIKSDPLGVLFESGVDYDQLTEAVLAHQNGVTPEINALKAEIKALREGVDQKLSERDTQAEAQVRSEITRNVKDLSAEGDTFALIRETRSVPEVVKYIERVYRETGELLPVERAMTDIESILIEDAEKLARVQKVQSRIMPEQQPQSAPMRPTTMRTLSNKDTARAVMSAKQRAIAAFNGTLKR